MDCTSIPISEVSGSNVNSAERFPQEISRIWSLTAITGFKTRFLVTVWLVIWNTPTNNMARIMKSLIKASFFPRLLTALPVRSSRADKNCSFKELIFPMAVLYSAP